MKHNLFLLLLIMGFVSNTSAQPINRDTVPKEEVFIDFSDKLSGRDINGIPYQYMTGDVTLHQGEMFMFCDSASLYQNNVEARGNVRIQKGDTTSVFADSLSYLGDQQLATLFSFGDSSRVILVDEQRRLYTRKLEYDLFNNVARYFNKGLLEAGNSKLTSREGIYDLETNEVFFKDSVYIIDSNFVLRSDTLKYHTEREVATFLGPTLIVQGKSRIYCEAGYYNLGNEEALFEQNPQYQRGTTKASARQMRYTGAKNEVLLIGNAVLEDSVKTATADKIRYDEEKEIAYLEGNASFFNEGQEVISDTIIYNAKNETYATRGASTVKDDGQLLSAQELVFDNATGVGHAEKNVVFADTTENIIIKSEIVDYNRKSDYVKAFGERPMFITILDGDSLFMASDTLISFRDTLSTDSARQIIADNDVRIFKSNLQAVCDSLVYESADSMFYFYGSPLIWSDTSQFSADSIRIEMKKEQIHRIYLHQNALIVNSADEVYFNQIKGKYITAFFKDNELYKMKVDGNAETVYYIQDEQKAYVGPNKVVCSEMAMRFDQNKILDITFFGDPDGKLFPMQQASHEQIKVPGFFWNVEKRPTSPADLLLPRLVAAKAEPSEQENPIEDLPEPIQEELEKGEKK